MVDKVVGVAFGLCVSKLRDKAADSLKGGDVTKEHFREIIVRELRDIRNKLDALCRKDLNSCIAFYEAGVHLLYDYFNKCGNKNQLEKLEQRVTQSGKEEKCSDKYSSGSSSSENHESIGGSSAVDFGNYFYDVTAFIYKYFAKQEDVASANEEDSEAEMTLSPELVEAKRQFQLASEYATLAFSNDALKGFDRITAQKFRIASTILMHFESPETALASCKTYLEELNSMPFVVETFEVEDGKGITDGIRRMIKKEDREQVLSTVKTINWIAFQFARYVSPRGSEVLRQWPNVLGKKEGGRVILPAFDRSFGSTTDFNEIAVNNNGQFAVLTGKLKVTLFSHQDKQISSVFATYRGETKTVSFDNNENILVTSKYDESNLCDENDERAPTSGALDIVTHYLYILSKEGKILKTLDIEGELSTVLCDKNNDIFSIDLTIYRLCPDHYLEPEVNRGQYVISILALKDAVANDQSETKNFLEKRGIILAKGVKQKEEILVLGPFGKALSLYTSYGRYISERIAWNSRNGDVIYLRGGHLEIHNLKDDRPFIFHLPFWGHGLATTPTGQIAVTSDNGIYVI